MPLQGMWYPVRPSLDSELILTKAIEELSLDWSAPEEPVRSCLDKLYLPGCRQRGPCQRPGPFSPKVHDELSKLWYLPFFA